VRDPKKREHKIYVDFLQNREGQTIAAPYCVRPVPKAPVSTPLEWKELTDKLDPKDFTIKTILPRLTKKGDIWEPFRKHKGINMLKALKALA
jgi:bifunctional non-homologous end joining protein LigD